MGSWRRVPSKEDDDFDLVKFVSRDKKDDGTDGAEYLIELGDFSVFTEFLKKIIGTPKDDHNV